jgi:hypothetical protein
MVRPKTQSASAQQAAALEVNSNQAKGDGRRWFCTPEEAEAAGWRRALK